MSAWGSGRLEQPRYMQMQLSVLGGKEVLSETHQLLVPSRCPAGHRSVTRAEEVPGLAGQKRLTLL